MRALPRTDYSVVYCTSGCSCALSVVTMCLAGHCAGIMKAMDHYNRTARCGLPVGAPLLLVPSPLLSVHLLGYSPCGETHRNSRSPLPSPILLLLYDLATTLLSHLLPLALHTAHRDRRGHEHGARHHRDVRHRVAHVVDGARRLGQPGQPCRAPLQVVCIGRAGL